MLEVHWFWRHWRTWRFNLIVDHEDRTLMYVVYLGCLVIAWHVDPGKA